MATKNQPVAESWVDANARAETRKPVESDLGRGQRTRSTYQVYVHHYKKHQKRKSKDPTKFQVIVQTTPKVWEYSGEISSGEPMQLVGEFSFQDGMFTVLNVHYNGDFTEYGSLWSDSKGEGSFGKLEDIVNFSNP